MSLDFFCVSSKTDGNTVCRIIVEPLKRQCSITLTIDDRIAFMADESEVFCKSLLRSDWGDTLYWGNKAYELAKHYSPFWQGKRAS